METHWHLIGGRRGRGGVSGRMFLARLKTMGTQITAPRVRLERPANRQREGGLHLVAIIAPCCDPSLSIYYALRSILKIITAKRAIPPFPPLDFPTFLRPFFLFLSSSSKFFQLCSVNFQQFNCINLCYLRRSLRRQQRGYSRLVLINTMSKMVANVCHLHVRSCQTVSGSTRQRDKLTGR